MNLDKDERTARQIVKDHPQAFNSAEVLAVIDAAGAISNALLDARIEERIKHTGESPDVAEKVVIAELQGSEL